MQCTTASKALVSKRARLVSRQITARDRRPDRFGLRCKLGYVALSARMIQRRPFAELMMSGYRLVSGERSKLRLQTSAHKSNSDRFWTVLEKMVWTK